MDELLRAEIETYFDENQYSLESVTSLATKIGRREEDILPVIENLIREEKLFELSRAEEVIIASGQFEGIAHLGEEPVRMMEKERDVPLEEGILTSREEEVFNLMIQGSNNQELAQSLHISENTVKNHVTSIFKKLGVQDRLQLIKRYGGLNRP